jgi:hypothetical protein
MPAMGISLPILIAIWGLAPTAWIVMWSALGLATVGLILLLRTRWTTDRKWRMCAVLSLWVHALIVVFSMTIRIVSGPPGPGDGGPISVAVLTVEPITAVIDPAESGEVRPVLDELTAPSLVAPEAEPLELEANDPAEPTPDTLVMQELTEHSQAEDPVPPTPFLEAPPLMPAPVEVADSLAATDSKNESQPLVEPQQIAEFADSVARAAERIAESFAATLLPQPGTSSQQTKTTAEDIPALYADRFANNLTELATERGGSSQTEAAVQAALAWLAANQSANGGWDASKFGAGIEREVLGHNRQGAGAEADTGVTGLAILAFLGSGNSHQHGSYRTEVAKALEFLRQHQRPDGSLFGEAELYARMYCHSMATLAACEAYALTRDERLDAMCRAAVTYSLTMQHPTDGGWRYRRGDTGDTSQLGWVLMALKSAQLAGIQVPDVTWTRAERFLRRVKRGEHGGLAAYRPDGPPSRTMTAEAWFCHQLLQADRGGTVNPMAIQEAVKSLEQELPTSANRNLYYWYYATLALHQNQQATPEDTTSWDSWNHALTTALIATQGSDGSWEADTVWGGYGGKVYTTALSALCLEVYYRYSPSREPRELAGREDWQSIQR